jgi:hypothetical protein
MTTIDIRDFQIVPERDSGRPIVAYEVEDFRRDGGDDYGAVIVRINVDGSFDLVQVDLVQTGDLAVLDRAIRALGDVRSELEVLYGAGGRGRGAAWRAGITGAVRRPRARGRPRVPHRGRVASRARRPVEGEGREGRELADVHSTRCPPRTRDLGGHRRVEQNRCGPPRPHAKPLGWASPSSTLWACVTVGPATSPVPSVPQIQTPGSSVEREKPPRRTRRLLRKGYLRPSLPYPE